GAAVLKRLDEPALDELERRLDQLLAGERVADLDGGPLLFRALAELLARQHRGAADPVATGRRAGKDDRITCAVRARACNPRGAGEKTDAHRVDEAIPRIRLVEDRLAPDRRDADAVPVMADPRDRAAELPAG